MNNKNIILIDWQIHQDCFFPILSKDNLILLILIESSVIYSNRCLIQDINITTFYSLCVNWKTNNSILILTDDVNTITIKITAVNSKQEVKSTFC